MKKVIAVAIIWVGIFTLQLCARDDGKFQKETTKISEETDIDEISYIREQLNTVIKSKEYKDGSIDIRVELLQPVLEQLSNEGYIVGYKYNLEGSSPNIYIEYANGGGGAIILKELSPEQN